MYDMGIKKIKSKPLFPKNVKLNGMPNIKTLHKPKKDRKYWETNLIPLGDYDRDGKINSMDCFPYDPSRQGIAEIKDKVVETVGKVKEKIDTMKEEKQEKKEEKIMADLAQSDKEESFRYIVIKYYDGNWVNLGAYTTDRLDEELYQIQQNPDIEAVQVTKDENMATKLNRQLMFEGVKDTAKEAGKYAIKKFSEAAERASRDQDIASQSYENAKAGLRVNPNAQADMQRMAQGPTGKPPQIKRGSFPRAYSTYQPTARASIGSIGNNANLRGLREAGQRLQYSQAKDRYLDQPFVEEKPYGYSQRSPNYQEVSPFGESVVPYRPIARRQVSVPNRPAKAPAWGSTVIDLGGSFGSRPKGLIPMAQFKFQKPAFIKFGVRRSNE